MDNIYIKQCELNKWVGKYFKNELVSIDDLISKIEDLDSEIVNLKDELKKLKEPDE